MLRVPSRIMRRAGGDRIKIPPILTQRHLVSIGGWCGPALALGKIGLRHVAFPFDFSRVTLDGVNHFINQPDFSTGFYPPESESGQYKPECVGIWVLFRGLHTAFAHFDLNDPQIRRGFDRKIQRWNDVIDGYASLPSNDTSSNTSNNAERGGLGNERRKKINAPVTFFRTIAARDPTDEINFIPTLEASIRRRNPDLDYRIVLTCHDQGLTQTTRLHPINERVSLWCLAYNTFDNNDSTLDNNNKTNIMDNADQEPTLFDKTWDGYKQIIRTELGLGLVRDRNLYNNTSSCSSSPNLKQKQNSIDRTLEETRHHDNANGHQGEGDGEEREEVAEEEEEEGEEKEDSRDPGDVDVYSIPTTNQTTSTSSHSFLRNDPIIIDESQKQQQHQHQQQQQLVFTDKRLEELRRSRSHTRKTENQTTTSDEEWNPSNENKEGGTTHRLHIVGNTAESFPWRSHNNIALIDGTASVGGTCVGFGSAAAAAAAASTAATSSSAGPSAAKSVLTTVSTTTGAGTVHHLCRYCGNTNLHKANKPAYGGSSGSGSSNYQQHRPFTDEDDALIMAHMYHILTGDVDKVEAVESLAHQMRRGAFEVICRIQALTDNTSKLGRSIFLGMIEE